MRSSKLDGSASFADSILFSLSPKLLSVLKGSNQQPVSTVADNACQEQGVPTMFALYLEPSGQIMTKTGRLTLCAEDEHAPYKPEYTDIGELLSPNVFFERLL